MPDYTVKKPCRPNIEYKTPGDEVSLTPAQAKYLLMSGHLTLKKQEPKPEESKPPVKKAAKTKKTDAQ
jgi:hypothetical protein